MIEEDDAMPDYRNRLKLLTHVRDNPDVKAEEIRRHESFRDYEPTTLMSLVYSCTRGGLIIADANRRYSITAAGRKYIKEHGSPTGVLVIPPPPPPPPPRSVKGDTPKPAGVEKEKHKPSDTWPAARLKEFKNNGNKFPGADVADKSNGTARAIAEQLLQHSQDALDNYIASVCDPDVLGRFRAQRDQARALVESFNGTTEQTGGES